MKVSAASLLCRKQDAPFAHVIKSLTSTSLWLVWTNLHKMFCMPTISAQNWVKFPPNLLNSPAKSSSFLLLLVLPPDFHHLCFLFPFPAGLLSTEVEWLTGVHDMRCKVSLGFELTDKNIRMVRSLRLTPPSVLIQSQISTRFGADILSPCRSLNCQHANMLTMTIL